MTDYTLEQLLIGEYTAIIAWERTYDPLWIPGKSRTIVGDQTYGILDSAINMSQHSEWPFKIEGITKDSSGDPLGNCTVFLLRGDFRGYSVIQKTTSDASTGAYLFYVEDLEDEYVIIAFKSGSPNVFGRTDKNLKAVAV